MLVLHIAGGSDFFLIIDGWMMPTCFGVPLEILARASGRLAILCNSPRGDAIPLIFERRAGGDEPGEGAVPEPVLQMVDFLLAEGRLKTPGLFLDPDSHAGEVFRIPKAPFIPAHA